MKINMICFSVLIAGALSACGEKPVAPGTVADLTPFANDHGTFTLSVDGISFELVPVDGGSFSMGETADQGVRKNPDIHQVLLDGFAIGAQEVTQELWKAVMGSNPSPKENPAAPVSRVTWEEAVKFTARLAHKTGLPLRLPTEAEWEFAARGGNASLHYRYSGSNEQVGAVNELGIKDMSGGVQEWCSDVWQDKTGPDLAINPTGPAEGDDHVARGGSAADPKADCVISTRRKLHAKTKSGITGLRLAVSTGKPCPQEIVDLILHNRVPRDPVTVMKPESFTVNGFTFKMMPVEGGTFRMGATEEHERLAKEDERPVHEVTLDAFMIGQYEVTGALWKAVMGWLPPRMLADDKPVGNISWYDAQAFIAKLNSLTGRKFRLPTEAEWEYAARGGRKTHAYPFAGSMRSAFVAQCETKDLQTRPVGQLAPNELGTYDMSGNAWEMCQDCMGPYSESPQVNPTGPDCSASGPDYRVMRGGSAAAQWDKCRTANRSDNRASYFKSTIGFRLAL